MSGSQHRSSERRAGVLVAAFWLAASVPAQVTWTEAPLMRNRDGPALAYDAARGRVVLFGGSGGGYLADTWEWDGNDWIQRTPSNSPCGRLYAA